MKKLLILSGKGGTGKTTIASSFIRLGKVRAYGDCDVDAPNLSLTIDKKLEPRTRDFLGMDKAAIDRDKCIGCGSCLENCRFKAIDIRDGDYYIDKYSCEGCGLCERLCPVKAISMEENIAGELKLYKGEEIFSTAELRMGEGNSGLLVTEVKKQLDGFDTDLAIIDGSPGIGCPVIASITGVDLVLIVAEPSLSGFNDLIRIVETSKNFDSKILVVINKYDISLEKTKLIEDYCREEGIELVGKIAFDKAIVDAINQGKSIVDMDTEASRSLVDAYERTMELINTKED